MIGRLWTVAALEVRRMLGGTRVIVLALLLAVLALLPAVVRMFAPTAGSPEAFWPFAFMVMLNFVFLQTVVLLVPLLLATSLIRNEVEDGTLVYLVTRPIPRPLLILAKFAAITVVSGVLVSGGMLVFLLAFLLPGGDPTGGQFAWGELLWDFVQAGLLGVLAYGALFTLFGLVFKRGLIWGLAYGFLSEFALTNVPAVVREATVMHYLRSVALAHFDLRHLGVDLRADELDQVKETLGFFLLASPAEAYLVVFGIAAVALALSTAVMSRREFAAEPTAEA